MKLNKTELSRLYEQYTAEHPPANCPAAEVLTLAAMGELNSSEREQVANHLGTCHNCGEEYQLILSLKPWAAQAAERIQAVSPQTSTRQRERIPLQVIREESSGWMDWLRSKFAIPSLALAAAALLLATSFLAYRLILIQNDNEKLVAATRTYEEQAKGAQSSIGNVQQELLRTQQQLEAERQRAQQAESEMAKLRQEAENRSSQNASTITQPEFNVHIVDLVPRDSDRGKGASEQQRIQIPRTSNVVTMILNVTGQPNFADYKLEVLNQQGKVVYQGRGLKKSPENTFTIALLSRSLPAGQYQFKLYGLSQGEQTLAQDYAVQIRYQ
ncbi:MAG TPA: hypothetical protein VEF04_17885 [Blastocatellia bacterium]|nr:hypothetical protein [Blastocatellia bacterium]